MTSTFFPNFTEPIPALPLGIFLVSDVFVSVDILHSSISCNRPSLKL